MNTEKTPFTWADLKRQVNALPEEMLSFPVRWWGEERGGKVSNLHYLEEEYMQTDEGFEPKSVLEKEDQEYYEGTELPKGYPIINVD